MIYIAQIPYNVQMCSNGGLLLAGLYLLHTKFPLALLLLQRQDQFLDIPQY